MTSHLDLIVITSCGHFIPQPAGAARPAPGGMSGMPKRSPAPRPAPAAARPPPRLTLSTWSPFSKAVLGLIGLTYSRAPANGGMSGGARSNGVSAGAQAQIEDLTTQVLRIHFAYGEWYTTQNFGLFRLSWMAVKPRHFLRKASLATCNSQWVSKSLSSKNCQALQIAGQLSWCPPCCRKI